MRTRSRSSRVSSCLALIAALGMGGCGGEVDELPRKPVEGAVKLDGTPLKGGMIQFMPADQGAATAAAAAVEDGKYSVSQAAGLVPGSYKVSITSSKGSETAPAGAMPGDPAPPAKEPIPGKYNAKTTLTARVTPEGPNTFDFDLSSKSK
ncbi:hypothetical protein [Paludisphaera rhizosphaerae]|uniref:hypothetical protein n=1 Tax=Paludisphaera rhizosphaerae TaxID=2711216 RepID=UPI001F10B264|nr:hypothetical protein [Paludisphaera rhizosphaerae]